MSWQAGRTRRFGAVLGTALLVAGCGGAASSVDEVVVGLLFPTTGPMAALGTDQSNAARMVLEWANDRGGVGGAKIRIVEGDSESDPATGAAVAQRMVDDDGVQVIIGSYASSIAQAVAPVAERNRVMLWELGAAAPNIASDGNRYVLRTVSTATTYAAADIDFLEQYLAPTMGRPLADVRVAIAHEDGPFGTSVAEAIDDLARKKNVTIVANESYPESSTDLTPVVQRLKEASPDVVLAAPLVASTPLFWQAARAQDLRLTALIGSAGFSSSAFLDKFGARGIEGVYDVEPPAVAEMNTLQFASDAREVADDLRSAFRQRYGRDCLVHCGDGLGGTFVLVKDVLPRTVRSGQVTGDSIREAANATNIADGGTPQGFGVKFDAKGDNERAESYIMQWQGGVLKVVFPADRAVAEPVFPMPGWERG
ncbi:ABC transporter substrate-binding protein [Actinophytocola oryzae]|uniref:Amino acid/amide ABC transporter substrate-binding protein (HAAT family) n=1 Tax=Actinophytocola oryzae TaxID=502181 RepID=A0A4R7VKB1_9PSEU|nr:ABC transporter substrate-binding protein [Actinophytocola oryzae]TDV49916.1 amino acid/amide ABC transporter substrate-binding protein (HAAT family) [Actinophytocola oryzae]